VSWRDERGFSLVDLLVAFAMLLFVLGAITTLHQGVLQAYVVGSNRTEVQQNARAALEHVARELRQTPSALTSATLTSLTLVDQDTGLAVTYALKTDSVPPALTRTTNGVSSVVIGNVQALSFAYRDVNEVVLAPPVGTPANVFRVDITIQTGSEDTIVAGGIADTKAELTTSVRLRNL
jgi:type II secretory pathway pseudopilin PulG